MVRLVYFGTNVFAADVLKSLAQNQGFSILAVVTRPPKPSGREQVPTPSPVAIAAKELGLPLLEPESLKNFVDERLHQADVFVVYAYGALLPKAVLAMPAHGTINLHPSLLPKYRGPTPVQTALINGDSSTGMSFMLLDDLMDHGPILEQITLPIAPDDTTDTVTAKLVANAKERLPKVIEGWVAQKLRAQPQDEGRAVICSVFTRDSGCVAWHSPAQTIFNLFRGLTPWPGIWTTWNGKRLKILRITLAQGHSIAPGTVLVSNKQIFVGTGSGALEVLELQLEGKKVQTAAEFCAGYQTINGTILGIS